MSTTPTPPALGTIGWADLTVNDADGIRDFYSAVIGWTPAPVDMGEYADYTMQAPGAPNAQAGICHARGLNAGLPAAWLIYVTVADLAHSLASCQSLGGAIIAGPRSAGGAAQFAVIRDPAGAVIALYQAG